VQIAKKGIWTRKLVKYQLQEEAVRNGRGQFQNPGKGTVDVGSRYRGADEGQQIKKTKCML
jgi:hypothetical protein